MLSKNITLDQYLTEVLNEEELAIIQPEDIYNFYYMSYILAEPSEKQYIDQDKENSIRFELNLIKKKYLDAFLPIVQYQLKKYLSRGRVDEQSYKEEDIKTSNFEALHHMMTKTYRSDMKRRNVNWERLTKNLAALQHRSDLKSIIFSIDRINNTIHNTQELILTKFSNGNHLLQALSDSHRMKPEQLKQKTQDLEFLKEESSNDYDRYWRKILSLTAEPRDGKIGNIEGIDIVIVNGDQVKNKNNMDFVEGGHDLVYNFIPKRTIWIDKEIARHDYKFIIFHEFIERKLMDEKKYSYEEAHKIANKNEHQKRSKFLSEDKNIGKAYVFDFDDTLVKTSSRIKVVSGGRVVKELRPEEFNVYKRSGDEVFDFTDFDKIIKPAKFKAWKILENVDKKISLGKSTSTIYILTARSSGIVDDMEQYFKSNGIKNINRDNIFAIGDKKGTKPISEKKKDVLEQIKVKHEGQVTFFDDAEDNIKLAQSIGVKTRQITESILDEPKKELDPKVWEGTPPTLNPEIFKAIAEGLVYIGEDAPITKLIIAGSLTGYRWTEESDLDVTVILDVDDDTLEIMKDQLSEVNGKLAPGTEHPINYFLMNKDIPLHRFDSAYEPLNKQWLKPPKTEGMDLFDVYDQFKTFIKKIDIEKEEAKRSLIDIKLLEKAISSSADPYLVAEKVVRRIKDLDSSLEGLAKTFKKVHKDRNDAFERYETSGGGVESPNLQPENVKYKMLERYHYLDFLKNIYKIMKKGGVEAPEGFEKVADLLSKNEEIVTTKFNEGKYEKMTLADIINSNQGKTMIAFDTETTGLEPNNPDVQITEIAGIAFDESGKELGRFHKKINLRDEAVRSKPIDNDKTVQDLLTKSGYDDKNTEFGDESEILKDFYVFVNRYPNPVLLAHNLQFDMKQVNTALKKLGLKPLKVETLDTIQFGRVFFEAVMNALENADDIEEVQKFKEIMKTAKGKLSHTLEKLGQVFQIKNEHWHSGIDDTMQLVQLYQKFIQWFKEKAIKVSPEKFDKELRSALKRKRSLQAWSRGQDAKAARAFRRSERRKMEEDIESINGDKALALAIGPSGIIGGKAFVYDKFGTGEFFLGSSVSGHTPLMSQLIKRVKNRKEDETVRGYWIPSKKSLILFPYVRSSGIMVNPTDEIFDEVANKLDAIPSTTLIVTEEINEENREDSIIFERKLSDAKKNIIIDFIKFVEKNEGTDSPVKIILQNGRGELRTTGAYKNKEHTLRVNIKNRALVDVLRTIAHELVHHRQNEKGDLTKHKHQDIGGPIEDEANAKSGIYIKRFAKETGTDIYADDVNILEEIEFIISKAVEKINAAE